MSLFGIGKKESKRPALPEKGARSFSPRASSSHAAMGAASGLSYPLLFALCDAQADPAALDPQVLLYKNLVRLEEVSASGVEIRAAVLLSGEEPTPVPEEKERDVLDLLLDEVVEEDREAFSLFFTQGRIKAGYVLYAEGEPDDFLYLIREGRLSLKSVPPGSKEAVEVEVLGPGEICGEEALLGHAARPVTVTAMEDALLLRAEGKKIAPFLARSPGLAQLLDRVRERRVAAVIAKFLGKAGG